MTRTGENGKLAKSAVGKSLLLAAFYLMYNLAMILRGAVVQLGARNTGSVEVTGSSPVSSTIFMYNRLAAAVLALILTFPAVVLTEKPSAANQVKYVPDVVVLVFSGVLPVDTVSCTYNRVGTTGKEAEQDVRTLESITRTKFDGVKIDTKALEPSKEAQTSSEFQVNGFVDYNRGLLVIEPFVTVLRRFRNIEVDYIINRPFAFRGLSVYDDKYVSVRLVKPYQYRVVVKNSEFTALNLPLVQPARPRTVTEQEDKRPSHLLTALGIALLAGIVVYLGARRLSRTPA